MRALAIAGLLLAAATFVPTAEAARYVPFTKTYTTNSSLSATDPFQMPDPGGPTPLACYFRTVHGWPTGAMAIRVVDHRGNTVFLDEVVGTPIVGFGVPVGAVGVIPGTWTVRVVAAGSFVPGVTVTLVAASSLAECQA